MLSLPSIEILIGLLAARVVAQGTQVKVCTAEGCENCPNAVVSTGPAYPDCVVYDRDVVLGGAIDEYEPIVEGMQNIWFDVIVPEDSRCTYTFRTPAAADEKECGVPWASPEFSKCTKVNVANTFMIQECCSDKGCEKGAGNGNPLPTPTPEAGRRALRASRNAFGASSVVLRDAEGNLIVPLSVGGGSRAMLDAFLEDHGLNASSVVQERSSSGHLVFKKREVVETAIKASNPRAMSLEKRDCTFTYNDEPTWTQTSPESELVSTRLCGVTGSKWSESHTTSSTWSQSYSVGLAVGIFTAGATFTFEETISSTQMVQIDVPEGRCGQFAFTPTLVCHAGEMTDCGKDDGPGEVCVPNRLENGNVDGTYSFVGE